jgi:hypothetical protein
VSSFRRPWKPFAGPERCATSRGATGPGPSTRCSPGPHTAMTRAWPVRRTSVGYSCTRSFQTRPHGSWSRTGPLRPVPSTPSPRPRPRSAPAPVRWNGRRPSTSRSSWSRAWGPAASRRPRLPASGADLPLLAVRHDPRPAPPGRDRDGHAAGPPRHRRAADQHPSAAPSSPLGTRRSKNTKRPGRRASVPSSARGTGSAPPTCVRSWPSCADRSPPSPRNSQPCAASTS